MTEEHKRKIGEAQKGKLNHRFGKHFKHSEETKKKIGQAHKGRIFTDAWRSKLSISALNRKSKKYKDTKPELIVELELIRLNIYFEKQRPLCKIAVVDFYLPQDNIIIQVDGCYWHNCPIHHPNELPNKTERDIYQDKILTSNGFNVYRIWEHDILKKDFNIEKFILIN